MRKLFDAKVYELLFGGRKLFDEKVILDIPVSARTIRWPFSNFWERKTGNEYLFPFATTGRLRATTPSKADGWRCKFISLTFSDELLNFFNLLHAGCNKNDNGNRQPAPHGRISSLWSFSKIFWQSGGWTLSMCKSRSEQFHTRSQVSLDKNQSL